MDCCNYGEFRHAHGQYAGAAWDGYGYALPYAPYAHGYYSSHAHDPYARYYRYDYPAPHTHHNEHATMPMDYGAYTSKESRIRRTLSRRDQRAHPSAHHLPLPHTPPSECGMTGRGTSYYEPQMWPHYQMGVLGGEIGVAPVLSAVRGLPAAYAPESTCVTCNPIVASLSGGICYLNIRVDLPRSGSRQSSRSLISRVPRVHSPHLSHPNPLCPPEGRSTPYPVYEDVSFGGDNVKHGATVEFTARNVAQSETIRPARERIFIEAHHTPPEEKRPPIVPLPAFQQAFGSTEIGKFAEAFSRAEVAYEVEDVSSENFVYESFQDWDGPPDAQWSSLSATREIKCEDNY